MQVTYDLDLNRFDFWSGAVYTAEQFSSAELMQLENYFEEVYGDSVSAGDVNNAFWFEADTLAQYLGYSDFEEVVNGKTDPFDEWIDEEEEETAGAQEPAAA